MKSPLIILLLASTAALMAGPRISANYSITSDITDAAGQRSASVDYTNNGSASAISGNSTVAAPVASAKHGYIGQLYEVTGLALNAATANVNEGDTLQLGAWQSLDDATFLSVNSLLVTWSAPVAPIASISAGGLATAGLVYQETPAVVEGTFGGFTAMLNLTVLNVNADDFGAYAGDGIGDDWQVQHFGPNNPLAAPELDADGDGQNNLLEFRAGYDPADPQSFFATHGMSVGGGFFTMELSRVQPGTRYIFERSVDLETWTDIFTLDPGGVAEPFAQSLPSPDPTSFFRVRLEMP